MNLHKNQIIYNTIFMGEYALKKQSVMETFPLFDVCCLGLSPVIAT
jgi:hypothetical protein